jgi:adenine-specific DNA glycosylase
MSGVSLERTCFISCLLARRCLIAGDRASVFGVVFHLEERQPEVYVDTHVHRVSKRLGLICPKVSADQAHEIFAEKVLLEWVYPLHVNLIRHGRRICHAQKPECGKCPLYSECAFVGSVNTQETVLSRKSKALRD